MDTGDIAQVSFLSNTNSTNIRTCFANAAREIDCGQRGSLIILRRSVAFTLQEDANTKWGAPFFIFEKNFSIMAIIIITILSSENKEQGTHLMFSWVPDICFTRLAICRS